MVLAAIVLTPVFLGDVCDVVAFVADERTGWGGFSQSLRYY